MSCFGGWKSRPVCFESVVSRVSSALVWLVFELFCDDLARVLNIFGAGLWVFGVCLMLFGMFGCFAGHQCAGERALFRTNPRPLSSLAFVGHAQEHES